MDRAGKHRAGQGRVHRALACAVSCRYSRYNAVVPGRWGRTGWDKAGCARVRGDAGQGRMGQGRAGQRVLGKAGCVWVRGCAVCAGQGRAAQGSTGQGRLSA